MIEKVLLLFFIMVLFVGCQFGCKLEGDKTHKVAIPIVEALANYAKQNGIPKSFKDIKNFPYKIEPCSKKPNILVCEVLKEGYYFKYNDEYYAIDFAWFALKTAPNGFGLKINYNTTLCGYEIYHSGKLKSNYLKPFCSMIGGCEAWGRQ